MHFEPVTAAYSRPQLFKKLSGKKYFNEEYSRNKGQKINILRDKISIAVKMPIVSPAPPINLLKLSRKILIPM